MATIIQRGDKWQAKIRKQGHPIQSKTFLRQSDAEAWARKTESEMERGIWRDTTDAEKTTLAAALAKYEDEVTPKKKGSTVEKYRIATWKKDKLAKRSLASIRAADLATWRDQRLNDGYAPATVRLELTLISSLYEHAKKDWGFHVENPVRLVKMPTVRNARERRLAPIEERYLLAALDDSGAGDRKNDRMGAVVRVAIETAARQGELCKLDWRDVDLKKGKKTAKLRDTKNTEDRTIPLSPVAASILESLKAGVSRISGLVFSMTESALKQSFRRAVVRARKAYEADCKARKKRPDDDVLVDLHFHDLRHEATSRLAEIFPIHKLAKITGHKDTRMLLRYYHPRAEDMAAEMAEWQAGRDR